MVTVNLRHPGPARIRLLVVLVVAAIAVIGALAANALGSFTGTVTPATDCPAGSLNSHVTGFTAPTGSGGGSGSTFYVNTSSVNIDFCANGAGLAAAQLQEKAVANGASSYSTAQTILAPTPSTTASGTFTGISLTTDGEYDFYTVAVSSAPASEAAPAGADLTI